ncbi:hypothetical protein ABT115_20275 [Streptomyces sp. NPDC001832]|uniref:hypothetical protein n=1 Tax=Streptomyces sp. NPDC001832 TaxID=3154527 RepID=UPI00331F47FB
MVEESGQEPVGEGEHGAAAGAGSRQPGPVPAPLVQLPFPLVFMESGECGDQRVPLLGRHSGQAGVAEPGEVGAGLVEGVRSVTCFSAGPNFVESWTVPETAWNMDTSTPTLLRVFRQLTHRSDRRRSDVVDALMQYLPTAVAVGYVHDEPDIDLPLPGPDFAEQVGILVAAASSISIGDKPRRREGGGTHIRRKSTNDEAGEHQRTNEGVEGAVRGGR